jgi:hypothetical protein
VPLVPPAREDMLGHARTHTPAQTRSIHKHDRSAGARAHMQGHAGPMGSPSCRCTRPEHRAKARISVGCCVLPIAGNSVARLVPRTRRCHCRLGHRWPAAPTSATSRKSKASASLDSPFQATHTCTRTPMQACTCAHAHAGKCDLDFLVCVCYCDEGFCCSVCVVPSTHCWPPHSH